MSAPADPFITYQMEDGSHIDEFSFVTELEWFDERSGEVRLVKRTYRLWWPRRRSPCCQG